MLSDNYPEMLGGVYVYPAGALVSGLWAMVRPFLEVIAREEGGKRRGSAGEGGEGRGRAGRPRVCRRRYVLPPPLRAAPLRVCVAAAA